MFYAQQRYYTECVEVTPEIFQRIVTDPNVARICNNAKIDVEQAMGYGLETEMGKKWHDAASAEKRKLPAFLFMAQKIERTKNNKGVEGSWRKAKAISLNGLCMLDIDHLDYALQTYKDLCLKATGVYEDIDFAKMLDKQANQGFATKYGILLVHITPSGHGLRIVFKGDTTRGNIADNQLWLAEQLGVSLDESCKDGSRMSFAVDADSILYLDNEIFTYNNEEFENKYGSECREGKSQPKHREADLFTDEKEHDKAAGRYANNAVSGSDRVSDPDTTAVRGKDADVPTNGTDAAAVPEQLEMGQENTKRNVELSIERNADGQECYKYRGRLIPYEQIVGKLVEARGGEPGVGGRNNMLYDLVRLDLRHICDNNADFIFRVAPDFGLSERERKATIEQGLSATRYGMSRTLRNVLENLSASGGEAGKEQSNDVEKRPGFNHAEIWNTFKPYLGGVWEPVTDGLDDNIKFAGFLAAGAMFGTYLSAVTLKGFYDNSDWRLSFMVYIIGQAASGKGAFVELNKLIMAPLRQRDEEGRRWEEQYKEDKEKRANSSKNMKDKAMEIQHFPIRVLPGTISNAMRYKRMKDSVRVINGENVHLHCYIFESELSAKLRSEQGTWAGAQDLDCKSFSNEYGGNDYGNAQATNGLIEVNMNQVITGTHDAMNRKITARNCLDGLATRLVMFEMPDSSYKMLKRENLQRTPEETQWLSTIGEDLIDCAGVVDLSQRVRVPKTRVSDFGTYTSISDALYQWGEDEARRCGESKDMCADYFRRRAPIIAARYVAVDAIMNDLSNFKNTGKVKIGWRSIELALHLVEYIQESQMYFFGQKILSALADESAGLTPQVKVRSTTVDLYNSLGDKFSLADVQKYIPNYFAANTRIRRWKKEGAIEQLKGKGRSAVYKKLKKVL